jgi:phage-related protein
MSIITARKIRFTNLVRNGIVFLKDISEPTNSDLMVGFIWEFKYVNEVDFLISIVLDAKNNIFSLTDDGYILVDSYAAEFTNSQVNFELTDGQTITSSENLNDFLEVLQAWKQFLITPPLSGQKI